MQISAYGGDKGQKLRVILGGEGGKYSLSLTRSTQERQGQGKLEEGHR